MNNYTWNILRWSENPNWEENAIADTPPWDSETTNAHVFEVFKQTETPDDPQADFKITGEKMFSSEEKAWEYLREMEGTKTYRVGVTIYNSFDVEATSERNAEEQVREMSVHQTLDGCDFNITYVEPTPIFPF